MGRYLFAQLAWSDAGCLLQSAFSFCNLKLFGLVVLFCRGVFELTEDGRDFFEKRNGINLDTRWSRVQFEMPNGNILNSWEMFGSIPFRPRGFYKHTPVTLQKMNFWPDG